MVTVDDVPNLRVVDLKAELKARDLPIAGLKAALTDRLIEALQAEGGNSGQLDAAEETAGEAATEADADAAEVTEPFAQAEGQSPPEEPTAAGDEAAEAAAAEPADAEPAVEEPAAEEPDEAPAEPAQALEAETASAAEGALPGEVAIEDAQPGSGGDAEVQPSAVSVTAEEVDAAKEPPPADEAEAAPAASEALPAPGAAAAAETAAAEPAAAAGPAAAAEPAKPATPAADAASAEPAAALPEAAEPMVEDEAPEMDFDVEPEEEEEPAAASRPASGKAAEPSPAKGSGKREREPIPGAKAPPKVDTSRRGDGPPAKMQRTEGGTPGTRRLSAHSDIPLVTPAARGGVKVPPPNMKPTAALRIDNFMRPFTLPQAKQLLSQQDAVIKENAFWMPNIKTHCYVIFETAEQAETIRQLTYNIQWPRDSHKRLMPKFVTVEEAETVISGGLATPRAAPAPAPVAPTPKATPAESPRTTDARKDILQRRQQREAAIKQKAPPQEMELDDLFRKTETRPHLYWLPVAKSAAEKSAPAAATANGKA